MANITYDPVNQIYIDTATGNSVIGFAPSDIVTFPANGGTPYDVTLPNGLDVQQIVVANPDATVTVGIGSSVSANASISNGGVLDITSAVFTGSISVDTNGVPGLIQVSSHATLNGSPGAAITFTGSNPTHPGMQIVSGSTVTLNIPFVIQGSPPLQLLPGSKLIVDGSLTTAQVETILLSAFVPYVPEPLPQPAPTIDLEGTLENTDTLLDLVTSPEVQVDDATIIGGEIEIGPASTLVSTSLNDVSLNGTLTIPPAAYDFLINPSGPATINDTTDLGLGSGTVGSLTINLAPNSLLYGEFGAGTVNVTFAPGAVINVLGQSQIAFDPSYPDTMILQGALNLRAASTPYDFALNNSTGLTDFAAGSSVIIGSEADLKVQTTLDNFATISLAGGTLEFDLPPGTLGAVDFFSPGSTLLIGAPGTSFAPFGALDDFSNTDMILFEGRTYGTLAHVSLSGGTLAVFDGGGTLDGLFTLHRDDSQTYKTNNFSLGAVAQGMTLTATGITPLAAPVITAGATAAFTGGGAPALLDPNLTLADPGSTTIAGATVDLAGNFLAGDTLSVAAQNGIIGSFNSASGTLVLSGTASLAAYQAALDSVAYSFGAGDPTDGGGLLTRIVDWVINDSSVTSLPAVSTADIAHTPPVVVAGGTVTDGGGSVALDTAITVSDVDSPTLYAATVQLGGINSTATLAATTSGTAITAQYSPSDETLYLLGTDSLANYQQVLRSVTFSESSVDPATPVTWIATDGVGASTAVSSTLMACFAAGTRIATPAGETTVEALRLGQTVTTRFSSIAAVQWLGHRRVDCRRHPEPRRVWPVRIREDAFGPDLPRRDLWLSPDHALFHAGVLIPVRLLIDGVSIVQVPIDDITYYHVELPRHDVLLAEGLPAESYLDTGNRAAFGNGGGVQVLFADFSAHKWEAEGCAPLVVAGAEVDSARRLLQQGAAIEAISTWTGRPRPGAIRSRR